MNVTATAYQSHHAIFQEIFEERFKVNELLSRYTSARIGGPADMLVVVHTAAELQQAVEIAYTQHVPFFILGGGSNILPSDAGIRGLVILNRARQVRYRHTGLSVVCTAESGMNFSSLARQTIAKGLEGLEWAVSVPGTVGGAVVGNAGAHGSDMSKSLVAATIWEPGKESRVYTLEEMNYDYRFSSLKRDQEKKYSRRVVLSAEIELRPESVEMLTARADGFIAHRKETQPGGASTGSMFKNPEHYYAGYLLEAAGLKGLRRGGAVISEKHANFFVNDGTATASDIHSLIVEAWHAVREQFGIELELEVEMVGDWQFEDSAT